MPETGASRGWGFPSINPSFCLSAFIAHTMASALRRPRTDLHPGPQTKLQQDQHLTMAIRELAGTRSGFVVIIRWKCAQKPGSIQGRAGASNKSGNEISLSCCPATDAQYTLRA